MATFEFVWRIDETPLTEEELAHVRKYFAPRSVNWQIGDTYLVTGGCDEDRVYYATNLRIVAAFMRRQ